ncbi:MULTISPECIES: hypothetical protein [Mycolicibacter]|uniref:Uncharacterized protein n=1 Tax=Mycolicibacter longobardus TaxID=1108812 RepID=A0A1X1YBZ5_9MYCO|nr:MULTISPECIES: hypothetical protein [Mycolicibacter]ORW08554.1 hypothetical protein AWC16_19340 [Mycolicibacter longobardus]RAV04334.1 hypothetical protein DQP56_00510 [Mycolicibacter senuensis]
MKNFKVGDLVQLDHEYRVMGNPSLFRIRSITAGKALLGQLSDRTDGYIGIDTEVDLSDPELVAPYPEVLAMYPRAAAAQQ